MHKGVTREGAPSVDFRMSRDLTFRAAMAVASELYAFRAAANAALFAAASSSAVLSTCRAACMTAGGSCAGTT